MVWECERLRKGRRAGALSARTEGNSTLREETTMTPGSDFFKQYFPHQMKSTVQPWLYSPSYSKLQCYQWTHEQLHKPLGSLYTGAIMTGEVRVHEQQTSDNNKQHKQLSVFSLIPCLQTVISITYT